MKREDPIRRESHLRSLLKGVSWRILATTTTVGIAFLLTGDWRSALSIGALEFFAKILLYYVHDRVWQLVPRGGVRQLVGREVSSASDDEYRESHARSVLKSLSWRVCASSTTVIIALLWLGDSQVAFAIGGVEFVAKFVVFYVHERAWQALPRGYFRRLLRKGSEKA